MSYSNAIEHLYQEELYSLGPKVLVVIPIPWDSLSESDQLLLSKILGSVKRTLASVQLIALKEADIKDLLVYRPSRIIAFGVHIKDQGEIIQPYKCFKRNGVLVLQGDRLDQLDDAKKKNLWNGLKEMFQVQA